MTGCPSIFQQIIFAFWTTFWRETAKSTKFTALKFCAVQYSLVLLYQGKLLWAFLSIWWHHFRPIWKNLYDPCTTSKGWLMPSLCIILNIWVGVHESKHNDKWATRNTMVHNNIHDIYKVMLIYYFACYYCTTHVLTVLV